jgi:hypothetical protein
MGYSLEEIRRPTGTNAVVGRSVPSEMTETATKGGFMPGKAKTVRGTAEVGLSLPREIDENLKRVYRERLEEDVPDRFRALLDALRAQEAGNQSNRQVGSSGTDTDGESA